MRAFAEAGGSAHRATRNKRMKDIGFNEAVLVSYYVALEDAERAHDLVRSHRPQLTVRSASHPSLGLARWRTVIAAVLLVPLLRVALCASQVHRGQRVSIEPSTRGQIVLLLIVTHRSFGLWTPNSVDSPPIRPVLGQRLLH